ncbi:MAG: hypothetical protein Q9201_003514 [Fulgogasparrea decipioides]
MDGLYETLNSPTVKLLLGLHTVDSQITELGWMRHVDARLDLWVRKDHEGNLRDQSEEVYKTGIAALDAFLQSNITGPPLNWNPADLLFPQDISTNPASLKSVRRKLIEDLSVDGEAVYQLIPNVELFGLAKCLFNHAFLVGQDAPFHRRWARVTVNFWHQKLLSENSASLQDSIHQDLNKLEKSLRDCDQEERARFLVQCATIYTQHGSDQKAREYLRRAAEETGFEFKLTGRLGKRTKFQEKDLSQLVVLAKSADANGAAHGKTQTDGPAGQASDTAEMASQPQALDLNDDTLLEATAFSKQVPNPSLLDETDISSSLAALDPSDQPTLQPLDSIILLAYALSITNTTPTDGLTREETLPYATRVLQGTSSNWQIYTQALLVRSRIEGYRSRTIERSVLQLQALVDQVVVETASGTLKNNPSIQVTDHGGSTSFLPRPKPSESAPAAERLKYINQLASPTRWKLEAELANRWVSLGGLRTALEIYERLQMWAEVALCWAANDREDRARKIIRRQLYASATSGMNIAESKPSIDDEDVSVDNLTLERNPLPADAPRLFCILGDLEQSPSMYDKAWEISDQRYARAQRSLGKHYFNQGDLRKAEEAYAKSLRVNALNHSTWFSLGCIRLQLQDWTGAVDAFRRAIQIEDTDAESWSNLAAALLQLSPNTTINSVKEGSTKQAPLDDEGMDDVKMDPQRHVRLAFAALKRAAALKRDSHRIWQNFLNVAVKLSPPPYMDVIIAQTRLIDLLAKSQGEECVDTEVMEGLVAHFIASTPSGGGELLGDEDGETTGRRGFENMLIELVEKKIAPLITTSRRLHLLTAKLSLHLQRPYAALQAYEKAWRACLNKWDTSTQQSGEQWKEVVDATVELVDAYESLGEKQKEGRGEHEVVAKDWKFKSRTAVRSVLGRRRETGEESEGYQVLEERLVELKGP